MNIAIWNIIVSSINNQSNDMAIIYKNVVPASHTGTTAETVKVTGLITANTFLATDIAQIKVLCTKVLTLGAATIKLYFNTTADISGSPILVGTYVSNTNSAWFLMERQMFFKGVNVTSQTALLVTSGFINDNIVTSVVKSSLSIDFSVNQYFVVTVTLANSGDTVTIEGSAIAVSR